MNNKKRRTGIFPFNRAKLTSLLWLIIFVVIILLLSIVIAGAAWQFVEDLQFVKPFGEEQDAFNSLLFIMIFSTLVGTALAAIGGRFFLRPLRHMTEATREIASGNFDVHVEAKGTSQIKAKA